MERKVQIKTKRGRDEVSLWRKKDATPLGKERTPR